jgi:hypothetical protein
VAFASRKSWTPANWSEDYNVLDDGKVAGRIYEDSASALPALR